LPADLSLLAAQGFPPIIPPAEPMRRDHFSEKKIILPAGFLSELNNLAL
jgi:hypothetical protein